MAGAARAYRFGEFTLDVAERQLLRNGHEVVLRPKAFDTVALLVERHGHLVTKDALLARVWPETSVSDAVVTHCIAEVRKALGDSPGKVGFVRTLSRAGYRFGGTVEVVEGASSPGSHPPPPAPRATPDRRAPTGTVAVLPFENLSPDPGNESFCDGLSEELINGLTKVRDLRVVAHSSSFQFKGRHVDARVIGQRLGVGAILEGSVRKSGDRLRVSAQLIDAANGYHVWSAQYDRRLEDVFAIQEEIAGAVLRELKVELAQRAAGSPRRRRAPDLEAYRSYLQGRSCWHRRFSGFLQKAIDAFQRAIEIDPGFAAAHAGLADSYSTLGVWAFAPAESVFPKAASLAQRALELDDGLAEAHASQALVDVFYRWAWPEAGRHLERALDLNPGSAVIRLWDAHYLGIVGRHDEAIEEVTLAQALDPLSPIVGASVGWTFHQAGEPDRAIAELRGVLEAEPGNGLASFYLGYALADTGRYDEAIEAFRQAVASTGGMPWTAESIGWVHGLRGDREGAESILHAAKVRMGTSYVPSSAIALLHLGLGDDGGALSWLERGYAERDALMPWLAYVPCFGSLRPDPRFAALLRGLGLA
jgi:serine/threonine-protein kinase